MIDISNLPDVVQKHPLWAVIVVSFAAVLITSTWYESVRIAPLKDDVERLHRQVSDLRELPPYQTSTSTAVTTSEAVVAQPESDSGREAPSGTDQEADYATALRSDSPYPNGFEAARIGTPMSVLMAAFPAGRKERDNYSVELNDGPFKRLVAWFERGHSDPSVDSLFLHLRDPADNARLLHAAIAAFGHESMTSESLGAAAVWVKFPGVKVTVAESGYAVTSSWAPLPTSNTERPAQPPRQLHLEP